MLNNVSSLNFGNNVQKADSPVFQNIQLNDYEIKDIASFQSLSADLEFQKEESDATTDIFRGSINGKTSNCKVVYSMHKPTKDKPEIVIFEGNIGNKNFELNEIVTENSKPSEIHLEGRYGDKEVKLEINIQDSNHESRFKNFINRKVLNKVPHIETVSIKGQIGDKEINLNIPGEEIPKDADTKDMLAFVKSFTALDFGISKGKIISVAHNLKTYKHFKEREEQRHVFFNENIKPFIMQILGIGVSTVVSAIVASTVAKRGGGAAADLANKIL